MSALNISIPLYSENEIIKKIKDRKYEDVKLLKDLEKNILKRRKYIVSPIKEGENVILLLSGGIDSITAWGLLLKHYKANVYPFYLANSFKFGERRSIWHYGRQFRKMKNYRKPYIYKISHGLFKNKKKIMEVSPEVVLNLYSPKMKSVMGLNTGANYLSSIFAGYYKNQLLWDENVSINKIISAVTADDGVEIHTQTQTFIRQIMTTLMLMNKDPKLEFFSIGLEKNLGYFLKKSDFIQTASKLGIKLNKTHSCSKNTIHNCNKCRSCKYINELIDTHYT